MTLGGLFQGKILPQALQGQKVTIPGAVDGAAPAPGSSAQLWLPPKTEKGTDLTFSVVFFPLIIKLPLKKSCLGLELIVITLGKSVCAGRDLLTALGCVPSTARCSGTCQHCRDHPLEPPSRVTLAQIPSWSPPPGMGREIGLEGSLPGVFPCLAGTPSAWTGWDKAGTCMGHVGQLLGCPACPLSPSPPPGCGVRPCPSSRWVLWQGGGDTGAPLVLQ